MPRSRDELNAAADAHARADGYANRSQAYRARKRGYKGKGAEYNARLDQRRTGDVVKRAAKGHLLGLKVTQAGTVISADLADGQGPQLWRELSRYSADRRVRVTIERNDGSTVEVGGAGGMRLSYLRDMHDKGAGHDGPGAGPRGARIITVTIA